MCAWCVWKQWEIWLQKCKIDKENNIMHANPNKNDSWKDRLIKKLKTENFLVSIGQKESREPKTFKRKGHFSPSQFD